MAKLGVGIFKDIGLSENRTVPVHETKYQYYPCVWHCQGWHLQLWDYHWTLPSSMRVASTSERPLVPTASTFSVSDLDFLIPDFLKLPLRKFCQPWLGSLIRLLPKWSSYEKIHHRWHRLCHEDKSRRWLDNSASFLVTHSPIGKMVRLWQKHHAWYTKNLLEINYLVITRCKINPWSQG